MPNVPVVHIARLILLGRVLIVGAWRARPVGSLWRKSLDCAWKNTAEDADIVAPHTNPNVGRETVAILPVESDLGFVVTAPDDDAGMITQAAHLVIGFGSDA